MVRLCGPASHGGRVGKRGHSRRRCEGNLGGNDQTRASCDDCHNVFHKEAKDAKTKDEDKDEK